ncbi:uncharacterized protein [Drosophila pseudoobscura]|uniref:DUF7775 domain-containing protein n=1 Tax=Drosophila pseudoobscura pseudoobscura TaxID=46245 RepID=A0A6I8URX0_DROPS|nr:uncharacterized protein LOC4803170 [Drosophila pseudoobscura]
MRPILFVFYTAETVANIFLMGFHISGFMVQDLSFLPVMDQVTHYFFTVTLYAFTVLVFFASINICTGNPASAIEEILRSMAGCILYVTISLMTLKDAEEDFHMMYIHMDDPIMPEKPVHPFFDYLRAQAVCSLVCSVIFLLHCLIVVDVLLSNEEYSDDEADLYDDENENDDDEQYDFMPVHLYVFGESVQLHLERYHWFREFSHDRRINI